MTQRALCDFILRDGLRGRLRRRGTGGNFTECDYAPRAPAGLPQSVQGIAGFVEEDGRELQQVESGLDQLGMADDDVDSALQLLAVPGLAFMSGHAGPEHASANPLGSQQLVQTGVNVVLAGVDGEHLTFTPARKLSLDFLYDSSLFRISLALI